MYSKFERCDASSAVRHTVIVLTNIILGSRVVDEILRLVPNVQVFRDSLRCIKLWAQSKFLESSLAVLRRT